VNFAPTQACTSTQISDLVSACFGAGTGCQTVIDANIACSTCALGTGADGGNANVPSAIQCFDPIGECFANTDACIALIDGNTTCASADFQLSYCLFNACDSASCLADFAGAGAGNTADNTAYTNCENAASTVACTTYNATANTACGGADSADGGAFSQCVADTNAEVIQLINRLCNPGNQQ
jgi:hypothetical protein